jgi:hypothetical protein
MDDQNKQNIDQIQFDASNLYREDQVTDLKVGSIQRLIPINIDGSDEDSRPIRYTGQAQLMSQMGPVPITAPIEADSLAQAIEKFPAAIQQGVDDMMEEVQRRQREEANKIVTPGSARGPGNDGLII